MAHWVDDFTVNHVDRGHFHNSALKIASFGIDDAQHGKLLSLKRLA
jgi:hypothetical protein